LTVTDQASRYLLAREAFESTKEAAVLEAFRHLFAERGLPNAIRSDNGVPFAGPNGFYNLSKLSVWWLRLGIAIERIRPGCPQQNGRHERMHLTFKREATRPPQMNTLQQHVRLDRFVKEFNTELPHEALDTRNPADVYSASTKAYNGLPDIEYPFHDRDALVTSCGRIRMCRKKINISIRTARPRTSGENLFVVLLVIDLLLTSCGPQDKPGRFNRRKLNNGHGRHCGWPMSSIL
jgi:hypothetical protein